MCLNEPCFPDCWKVSSVVHVFMNAMERSSTKNYCPFNLLSVLSKVFEKLVNNWIFDHLEKCVFFLLISSIVLGLLEQLQIFWHLYQIELLWLWGYSSCNIWYVKGLMESQVRCLALFLLFSIIDSFRWLWMGSLHKNIQLMLEFLKAPFLVLHFSFYTLMTFLMMFSVILLFVLMILLSTLGIIRHLIFGNY